MAWIREALRSIIVPYVVFEVMYLVALTLSMMSLLCGVYRFTPPSC
ncbi:hypothetical protein [uncultured Phocaeicola sp.]|nr:hypothetical protein [uncultured Phocaeicola sp.]